MDTGAFPSIPPALGSYYQELLAKNPSHPLVEATRRQGEEQTWKGINELFRITSLNTGLTPERLLRDLGFDERNQDDNHLQAIWGVMRATNMLHSIGFVNICPLPPRNSRRESDLKAEYGSTRFAVEVFRSSEAAYRFADHNNPRHNLQNYIAQRYPEKRQQLDATMNAHQCDKALLVVVMDSQPAKALMDSNEWEPSMNETFELLGSPTNTHLLIFTGLKDLSTGKDEYAIYPRLVN